MYNPEEIERCPMCGTLCTSEELETHGMCYECVDFYLDGEEYSNEKDY